MRVLLDTNVILDALLQRAPWVVQANSIWQASQLGRLEAAMTASALTDVYYIARRHSGATQARIVLRACLDDLTILPVDEALLEQAWLIQIADFEDALQVACAVRDNLDAIVTRDPAGFVGSSVPVLSPTDLIARLSPPANPP